MHVQITGRAVLLQWQHLSCCNTSGLWHLQLQEGCQWSGDRHQRCEAYCTVQRTHTVERERETWSSFFVSVQLLCHWPSLSLSFIFVLCLCSSLFLSFVVVSVLLCLWPANDGWLAPVLGTCVFVTEDDILTH